ncbi:MAG TPA: FG-GAP repeat protein [Verrucomicrobiae bacterium]|nr:FG-GAP repeat protein [Verrucomicrobiae bacterium]
MKLTRIMVALAAMSFTSAPALAATPLDIAQQAYLKASNTDRADQFAHAVAISGNTVVVGAQYEDSNSTGVNGSQANNSAIDSGAAYVFVRDGTNWTQQAYLKASNTGAGDRFGYSVAVSDDTIVIGAVKEDSNSTGVNGSQANNSAIDSGAAYVFVRDGTNWTQQAYLKASNTGPGDLFADTLAISGDTIVVGAFQEGSNATGVNGNQANDNALGSGAAYVFVREGTNWAQQAYLKASNTQAGDGFFKVGVSGDTIVVGAVFEASNAAGVNGNELNNSAAKSGAAYVFVREGTNWSQQAYLKASNTGTGDWFFNVAISGDTILVGAMNESSNATGVNGNQANNSATSSGAAYVFVREGTNWSQQAYLKASNTGAGDEFGWAVSLSGDTAVIGAHLESSNAVGVNGVETNNLAFHSGAAYVFVREGTNWVQHAYLKASNTGANDEFGGGPDGSPGTSVAVSADMVVIGASFEDSNATGINGVQTNNVFTNSGAAYVFTGFCPTCFKLTLAPDATSGYFFNFSGAPEITYRLERAVDINGPWDAIDTQTAPPTGLIQYHETNAPSGQSFYRTRTL